MIYFILDRESRAVKVGFTDGPPLARLASLQTGNPHVLELAGTTEGDPDYEAHIHRVLRPWRMSGEWFRVRPASLERILRFLTDPEPAFLGWPDLVTPPTPRPGCPFWSLESGFCVAGHISDS